MKKTLKSIVLLTIIAMMIVMLTGCGNKLTATITTTAKGVEIKETIEVKFKKDQANEVKAVYEFKNEEEAIGYYEYITIFLPAGIEVEQKGNKITMNILMEDSMVIGIDIKGASKSEVKERFENEGYEVK